MIRLEGLFGLNLLHSAPPRPTTPLFSLLSPQSVLVGAALEEVTVEILGPMNLVPLSSHPPDL